MLRKLLQCRRAGNLQGETMNSIESLKIVPLDAPLGAEIRGVDFARPVAESVAERLRQAWQEHLILLFRDQQHISERDHVQATRIFGAPVAGANRQYFERAGRVDANAVVTPEITVISNLNEAGEPVMENEGLGSGEVVWHSDNSYIETPPIGSFLLAKTLPPAGGRTSWNNQYLAYQTLPDDLKTRISGLYTKHDASRNSAGKLRVGVTKPETLADVPGPNHPLLRIVPETGRPALYLGRRRVFPSQYVIGWNRQESEELLDFLWAHATHDSLQYTHTWSVGDMVLWDNRCCMHYREPLSALTPRIMHRTQLEHQEPIPA